MTRKDEHYSNPHRQPPIPSLKVSCIPQSLRDLAQWIGWGTEWRDGTEDTPGRWAKVPLNALFAFERKAKSNDPATWTTFDRAYQAAKNALTIWTGHCRSAPAAAPPHRPVDGLGFVFAAGGGLFGLDIDNCRNPDTGELTPLAASLIERFASYAEVSPSGTGVKIFGRSSLPWTKGRRVKVDAEQELELYDRGRYFTVTGVLVPGSAQDLTDCGDALTALIAEHFPEKEKRGNTTSTVGRGTASSVGLDVADDDDDLQPAPPPAAGQSLGNGPAVSGVRVRVAGDLTDDEVIGKLQHMKGGKPWALWQGDKSGHGNDWSRADLALCNALAFFCGPTGHSQVDRLFRQSGLMRPKWDEPRGQSTVGADLIAKAIAEQGKFWSGDKGKPTSPPPQASITGEVKTEKQASVAAVPDSRPVVLISEDEAAVNVAAACAIASRGGVYVRGSEIVQVVTSEFDSSTKNGRKPTDGQPYVQAFKTPSMRHKLSESARFEIDETRKAGTSVLVLRKPAHVPDWCSSAIVANAKLWSRFQRLDAIINHPVLSRDGLRLIGNGYDPSLRAFIHAGELEISVPDAPTLEAAMEAVRYLRDEVVCDFPFDTQADFSVWLAMLLTPLAWFMYDGSTPFFLVTANKPGAGKGLLVAAATIPLIGRVLSPTAYKRDEDEFEKRMGAIARSGRRFVLFDNLVGTVGNPVFDMALTGRWFSGRILGETAEYEGPIHAMFIGTGNKIELVADTPRRTLPSNLVTAEERPESRSGFKHPDLVQYLTQNRERILAAAVTILKAWCVAGRPKSDIPKWGSFDEWSNVVREAIVWAGEVDPIRARDRIAATMDRDRESHARMMEAILRIDPGRAGVTSARMMELAQGRPSSFGQAPIYPDNELLDTIMAFCSKNGTPPKVVNSQMLGYKLREKSTSIIQGQFIGIAKILHSANYWAVFAESEFESYTAKTRGGSSSSSPDPTLDPPLSNSSDDKPLTSKGEDGEDAGGHTHDACGRAGVRGDSEPNILPILPDSQNQQCDNDLRRGGSGEDGGRTGPILPEWSLDKYLDDN